MKHPLSFLTLPGPEGGKKLLEHETSAQFLSASFNIVCEERAVYICLSIYLPVPFSAFQPSLNSGIHSHIRGQDCALRVGGLSLPIEDSAHSLKLIRCPTQAKGSSSMFTNINLVPPSVRLRSRYTMSCQCHLPECFPSCQLRVFPALILLPPFLALVGVIMKSIKKLKS